MTSERPPIRRWAPFIYISIVLLVSIPIFSAIIIRNATLRMEKASSPPITNPEPQRAVQPVSPAPKPAKPMYKITPMPPSTGAFEGFFVVVDECYRRDIRRIICIGQITDTTDAPSNVYLGDSNVVDDEGNTFMINGTFAGAGGFGFGGAPDFQDPGRSDGGGMEELMPGVATKFHTVIDDDHQNVRVINLMLNFSGDSNQHELLTFPNISVQ